MSFCLQSVDVDKDENKEKKNIYFFRKKARCVIEFYTTGKTRPGVNSSGVFRFFKVHVTRSMYKSLWGKLTIVLFYQRETVIRQETQT